VAPAAGTPERREAIVANVQNGERVLHANGIDAREPFLGYTDSNLERIVPDAKLRLAFELALSVDDFRTELAPRFVALPNARVTRQDADPARGSESAWAYTYATKDWIVIGDALYQEEPGVIAAVIVHEVYHAVHSDSVGKGEACLDDEVNAHNWGSRAFAFTLWKTASGRAGERSPAGQQLHADANRMINGTLREHLREGYTRNHQCF
jgi:hypothetical protein